MKFAEIVDIEELRGLCESRVKSNNSRPEFE